MSETPVPYGQALVGANEIKQRPLTAPEIKANVQLIQEVMKSVMKEGTHYGIVQGCGNKKTLLKPGTETLLMTFRIAPFPEVFDLSNEDEKRYRVCVTGKSIVTGAEIGSAWGECSTSEEKYKWKAAVHPNEFEATPEDKRRIKYKNSGEEIQQIRTNPSDLANTVLKMAVKRAMVAFTLTATAASDIFVQDLEDMEDLPNGDGKPKTKTPPPMPEKKAAKSHDEKPREMQSKYDGFCKHCGDSIIKGDKIIYSQAKGTFHPECWEKVNA